MWLFSTLVIMEHQALQKILMVRQHYHLTMKSAFAFHLVIVKKGDGYPSRENSVC